MSALPSSVIQTERHSKVSDRYTNINTESIINKLMDNGFELYEAKQSGARKEENQGFQKHLVTMKYNNLETAEGVPTVVIRNSHNCSSGLSLFSGWIRFACFNGLIAGTDIESFNIQHQKAWEPKVDEFIYQYESKIHQLMGQYDAMKHTTISPYTELFLAKMAGQLRYSLDDYMDVRQLTAVHRIQDRGDDLFTVYNRIQENLIQGDFERRIITESEDLGMVTTWGKAKKITNTDEVVRLNRSLHNLAMVHAS
jgi:hypothetical protein